MPISVRVIQKGLKPNEIIAKTQHIHVSSKIQLGVIAKRTAEYIVATITQNSKNPPSQGGIRNNMKAEKTATGYGIGKIADLPDYWLGQNYGHGGYTITAKNVKYLKFKGKNGKWVYRKSVHNHPIRPINFVEKGIVFILSQLATFKIKK